MSADRVRPAWRCAGSAAGVIAATIMLGCMSFSFEGRKEIVNGPDGTYAESGQLTISPHQEIDVYYPVPYASPPNLVLKNPDDDCTIVEQKADHFRVQNGCSFAYNLKWTARGIKGPAPFFTPPPEVTPTTAKSP